MHIFFNINPLNFIVMETNDFTKEIKLNGPVVFLGEDFLARVKNIGLDIDPMDSVRHLLIEMADHIDTIIRPLDFPGLYPEKSPLTTIKEAAEMLALVTHVAITLEVSFGEPFDEEGCATQITRHLYNRMRDLVANL